MLVILIGARLSQEARSLPEPRLYPVLPPCDGLFAQFNDHRLNPRQVGDMLEKLRDSNLMIGNKQVKTLSTLR